MGAFCVPLSPFFIRKIYTLIFCRIEELDWLFHLLGIADGVLVPWLLPSQNA